MSEQAKTTDQPKQSSTVLVTGLDGLRHARKLLAGVLAEVTSRSQQPYERGQRDALRELDDRLKRACKL